MNHKVILFLLFFISLAAAQNSDAVSYSADNVSFSRRDTVIKLTGNCTLNYGSVVLTADSIHYHADRKIMIATGNPVMIDGSDTLVGDYIAYNLNDKTGKVRQGTFDSKGDLHYGGERIARGKDEALWIDNGSYTTSQAIDSVHYFFYGKKIKLIPNDKSVVKPFVLNIEEAPVAVLPFIIAPLKKDRKNGLLTPRWGVGINGSGSVDNIGYYWAPNDYVDFLVAGKINNFEEFLLKGESRYSLKNKLSGSIYADIELTNAYQSSNRRWSLRFNHNQNLLPDNSLTLKGRGSLVSDKDYNKDFSEDTTDLLNQNLSSNLSLNKNFKKLGGNASINWDMTQNLQKETRDQSAPSLNFDIRPRALIPLPKDADAEDEKWFNKIRWSYTARANQKIKSSYAEDSSYTQINRGFSHKIPVTVPIDIKNYVTITPRFTVNHAIFDSYIDTTTYDTTLVYDTTYDSIPIIETEDTVFKEKVISGEIVIVDTLYPPYENLNSYDTLVRYNEDIESREVVNKDTTYWHEDEFSWKKANNVWWDAGVTLNTRLYGLFPVNIGNITGFRHTFSPEVRYTFTPKKDLDVRFPSVSGISSTTGTKKKQTVSLGMTNLFESRITKNEKDKKIKLLTVNANASYDFEAEKEKWSNITLSSSVPTPLVDMNYNGSYTPYNTQSELIVPTALNHSFRVNPRLPAISGSFWSGDFLTLEKVAHDSYMDGLAKANKTGWKVTVNPNYNMSLRRTSIDLPFNQTKTYNLGAGLQFDFSHRWSIRWNGTWSFTEGTFINQSVSLYGDLESWEMKFDWYPTGINSGRFYFLVNIKKHRDIQWEKKEND